MASFGPRAQGRGFRGAIGLAVLREIEVRDWMWRFDRLRAETRSAVGGPMSGELEDRGQGQPFDGLRAGVVSRQ